MSDDRIDKIEWATTQPPYAWLAKPALGVIWELQAERDALVECIDQRTRSINRHLSARETAETRLAEIALIASAPEGHGWLRQSEWQRLLDVERRRKEEAKARERAKDEALNNALTRMDRARKTLQDSYRRDGWSEQKIQQHANWGVLDTSDLRATLAQQPVN